VKALVSRVNPEDYPRWVSLATKLIEICDKYMEAAELEMLKPSQGKLAKQAGIIMRSCAKIGIIALVDEATGFQKLRPNTNFSSNVKHLLPTKSRSGPGCFQRSSGWSLRGLKACGIHRDRARCGGAST